MINALEMLLGRGTNLYIGYGLGDSDGENAAELDLSRLAKRYTNFDFRRIGNTHAKILIKDNDYYVNTSFNWLSFKGSPKRTYRDERGVLIGIEKLVSAYAKKIINEYFMG